MRKISKLYIRIIPRLDIKGPNLVKGIHLEGLRVLGKPQQFSRYYYEHGADELIYMDVVASLYGRNSLLHIVEQTSREIFIPLTVGGGLRTLADIRAVLRAGADKVSLNTAALAQPQLVREAAKSYGSSTIVISIEAKKQVNGSYECYTDNGRERTRMDVLDWAARVAELGAGEILLTSIDREGTGQGYDVELTRRVAEIVPIPVIACGGAGKLDDLGEVIEHGKADAVCAASLLHYRYLQDNPGGEEFFTEGNVDYLRSGQTFSRVRAANLDEIKGHLAGQGIACRPAREETSHV